MASIILSKDGVVLKNIPLIKQRTHIGRRTHNDIVIDEPGISGEHAIISSIGEDFYFEDAGSTNGSEINGDVVAKHLLRNGDVIGLGLGRYKLQYSADLAIDHSANATVAVDSKDQSNDRIGRQASPYNASIHILTGPHSGKIFPIIEAVTTIGHSDLQIAALTYNDAGFSLTQIKGEAPLVNGCSIASKIQKLSAGDEIVLSSIKLIFQH